MPGPEPRSVADVLARAQASVEAAQVVRDRSEEIRLHVQLRRWRLGHPDLDPSSAVLAPEHVTVLQRDLTR
jgi:hypothetical protein